MKNLKTYEVRVYRSIIETYVLKAPDEATAIGRIKTGMADPTYVEDGDSDVQDVFIRDERDVKVRVEKDVD